MHIKQIIGKYKNEWVLVKVVKTDKLNRPLEGELLAHSKNRDDIYTKMKRVKGHTYTRYTGDIPQKGYAAAFLW